MFLRFNVLFLAILFAVNLWTAANYENYSTWIGIVFSLVLIVAARLVVGRWKYLVLPAILVPGSVFLLFLIDSPSEVKIFEILASTVFYFAVLAGWRLNQYKKDETAKAMYNLTTIAALFCWYAAAYGWYLNVALPIWILMVIFAVVTFLVTIASLTINGLEWEKRLIYSVFLSCLAVQTVWVQNFWPFGYLTTAVVALIIYCVGWEIIINFFLERITLRAVAFEVLFLIGSITLILLSTKWYPVT